MSVDLQRMTQLYLTLWKLLDMQVPGHHWLEVSSTSQGELEAELQRIEVGAWAEDKDVAREDITRTLTLLRGRDATPEWSTEAVRLRQLYQDKALDYAARVAKQVSDTPPSSISMVSVSADLNRVLESITTLKHYQRDELTSGATVKRFTSEITSLTNLVERIGSQVRLLTLNMAIAKMRGGREGSYGALALADRIEQAAQDIISVAQELSAVGALAKEGTLSKPRPYREYERHMEEASSHAGLALDKLRGLELDAK